MKNCGFDLKVVWWGRWLLVKSLNKSIENYCMGNFENWSQLKILWLLLLNKWQAAQEDIKWWNWGKIPNKKVFFSDWLKNIWRWIKIPYIDHRSPLENTKTKFSQKATTRWFKNRPFWKYDTKTMTKKTELEVGLFFTWAHLKGSVLSLCILHAFALCFTPLTNSSCKCS